jgi:hypothetical protein
VSLPAHPDHPTCFRLLAILRMPADFDLVIRLMGEVTRRHPEAASMPAGDLCFTLAIDGDDFMTLWEPTA